MRMYSNQNQGHLLDTATEKSKIGDVRLSQNQYRTAYAFYKEAFEIRRIVLGSSHFDTIQAAFNAGKCLHCLGKPDHALRYYKIFTKALFKAILLSTTSPRGRNDSHLLTKETVLMTQSIAWAFHQERSFNHASMFYRLALETARNVLGEKHKVVARILSQFGKLMFESGDMASALKYYLRGLKIEGALQQRQMNHINEDVLDFLTTISNIACTLEQMGQLENSLECYNKILLLRFQHDDDDDDATSASTRILAMKRRSDADTLLNMARVHWKLERPVQALEALNEALLIQKQEYGCDHSIVASTLNEIGIIHGEQEGHTHLALQFFEESLRIRVLIDNPDQRTISSVLYNMARIHERTGDSVEALVHLKKVAEHELLESVEDEINKVSSPEVLLDVLELMAQIYEKLDDPREALACLEKGIRIIMGKGPNVVSLHVHSRYLGMAGNVCLRLGNIKKVMHFFIETMRVNIAGGLAFDANIKVAMGYEDVRRFESEYVLAAAAA